MMKKTLGWILGLGFSLSALAAEDGMYVGLQLGQATNNYTPTNLRIDSSQFAFGPLATSNNRQKFGGRFYFGYQVNEYFAGELGFSRLGRDNIKNAFGIAGANVDIKPYAVDLMAKGMMTFNQWVIFGKLGVADVRNTHTITCAANSHLPAGLFTGSNQNKWRPAYGLGVAYDYTPAISFDLSINFIGNGAFKVNNNNSSNNIHDARLGALGIAYHFG